VVQERGRLAFRFGCPVRVRDQWDGLVGRLYMTLSWQTGDWQLCYHEKSAKHFLPACLLLCRGQHIIFAVYLFTCVQYLYVIKDAIVGPYH